MDVPNKEAVLASSLTPQNVERQDTQQPPPVHSSAFKSLGILDQFLALWIFLAMLIGILRRNFVPRTGCIPQRGEFLGVSIPIGTLGKLLETNTHLANIDGAIGLLVMMHPILRTTAFKTLHHSFRQRSLWVQAAFSILVNWIVAPLFMVPLN